MEKDSLKNILDLNRREVLTLAPLVAATIGFGIYPAPIFHIMSVSVEHLMANYAAALAAHEASGAGHAALDAVRMLAAR